MNTTMRPSKLHGGKGRTALSRTRHLLLSSPVLPIRMDGFSRFGFAYDDVGAIDHPEDGTYTLTYGEAVDLGYCRPVTFHRHEGKFTIDLEGGQRHPSLLVTHPAQFTPELKRIPGLQRAPNFYRLACRSPVSVGWSDPQTGWVPKRQ